MRKNSSFVIDKNKNGVLSDTSPTPDDSENV